MVPRSAASSDADRRGAGGRRGVARRDVRPVQRPDRVRSELGAPTAPTGRSRTPRRSPTITALPNVPTLIISGAGRPAHADRPTRSGRRDDPRRDGRSSCPQTGHSVLDDRVRLSARRTPSTRSSTATRSHDCARAGSCPTTWRPRPPIRRQGSRASRRGAHGSLRAHGPGGRADARLERARAVESLFESLIGKLQPVVHRRPRRPARRLREADDLQLALRSRSTFHRSPTSRA